MARELIGEKYSKGLEDIFVNHLHALSYAFFLGSMAFIRAMSFDWNYILGKVSVLFFCSRQGDWIFFEG
jgi:hypothetical protein